ncbi:hypothetical protein ABK040_009050 [Willaertia magna]
MNDKNLFKDCLSLKGLWAAITASVKSLLKEKGSKVPIFVTAVAPQFDTHHINELVEKAGEEGMLKEYYRENKNSHEKMMKSLMSIIEARKIKYTQDELNEFQSHFGTENFVNYIRKKQLEGFISNIPKVTSFVSDILNNEEQVLVQTRKAKEELDGLPPQSLVLDFFKLFCLLLHSITIGRSIEDRTSTGYSARYNEFVNTEDKIYNPSRPAPLKWVNGKEWEMHKNNNCMTMEQEILFSVNSVPFLESSSIEFPFSLDKDINDQYEKEYVDAYKDTADPAYAGVSRMKNLIREASARLSWINPGQITKSDLRESNKEASVQSEFDDAVNFKLSSTTESLFKDKLAKYLARRFGAILWHCVTVVVSFLETIPQFHVLTSSNGFIEDALAIFAERHYRQFKNKIQEHIEEIASRSNTLIDHWSPLFYELAPLLMIYDKKIVEEWIDSHPSNTSFSSIMKRVINKPLEFSNDLMSLIKEEQKEDNTKKIIDSQESEEDNEELNNGGLKKFFYQGDDTFITDLFRNWERPALSFFKTSWRNIRINSKRDRSDIIMYLMGMADSPDAVGRREQQYVITEKDVARSNYVYQRMFRSRVFDVIRAVYSELMKGVVESQDFTKLAWEYQVHFSAFVQHLHNEKNKEVTEETAKILMKEKYGLEDKREILGNEVKTVQSNVENLRSLLKAVHWFKDTATNNMEAITSVFDLNQAAIELKTEKKEKVEQTEE